MISFYLSNIFILSSRSSYIRLQRENPFAFGIFHVLQSKILYKGDQILKVNGVDVRRLTCDQIVNILRVAVYNNGYALVQVIFFF